MVNIFKGKNTCTDAYYHMTEVTKVCDGILMPSSS